MKLVKHLAAITLTAGLLGGIQSCSARPAFSVVVLGCEGGLTEGNLSSYLVSRPGSGKFLGLDAGTVLQGLRVAQQRGSFKDCQPPRGSDLSPEGYVLREGIAAIALSHAHIDHVAGLVIDSTDDSSKPLLGTNATIDDMKEHLFNWKTWPNFGNEGERPMGKYRYTRLAVGQAHEAAGLTLTPYLLSHSEGYPSTAFLIQSGEEQLLYCGDTGPDAVEHSTCLADLWDAAAPAIRQGRMHGLFLEVSYPDPRKDNELYGHLTPTWMMRELHELALRVNPQSPETALRGLTVVVTHIKPSLQSGPSPRQVIREQLQQQNDLGVKFVFPEQGQRLEL